MSRVTVSYAGMEPKERDEKAVADVKDYLGAETFDRLVRVLSITEPPKFKSFEFELMIVGIEGVPARAFYNHIWPQAKLPPVLKVVG